jgi:serine/threonine-protein kinase
MSNEASRRGPGAPDAPDEPDDMVGRLLAGRYRVDGLLARGGMARVYRARDVRLERDVAAKVLASPYADDPGFVDRFLAEARAAASISHPSLVHVYDSGTDGAANFIVMELLDRHRTLREVLSEHGPLSVADVGRIGAELLAGLRAVHDRGLVHCDVKAGNVMLGPGPAKLIDFGIAQSHRGAGGGEGSGTSMGTLSSMSPEQLAGEALTPASDLFSLGTVLYEALTGRLPFPGRTAEDVRRLQAAGDVVPPSRIVSGIPAGLDGLVLQSLRREPAARFRTAEAMARALNAATTAGAWSDPSPSAPDDETRVVPVPERPSAGYVPPRVDDQGPGRTSADAAPAQPARPPRRAPPRARGASGGRVSGLIAALAIVALLGAVVAFVVLPALDLPGLAESSPSGDPVATPRPTVAPDVIPAMVGLPAAEAIAIANEAGLNWVLECAQNDEQPDGIIDQEPPAGTQVAPGSRFTMFSARIADCRGGDENGGGNGRGNGNGRGDD